MIQLKEQGIVTWHADGLTVNYIIAEEYSDVIANCINILSPDDNIDWAKMGYYVFSENKKEQAQKKPT
jgi:hypothetical protein